MQRSHRPRRRAEGSFGVWIYLGRIGLKGVDEGLFCFGQGFGEKLQKRTRTGLGLRAWASSLGVSVFFYLGVRESIQTAEGSWFWRFRSYSDGFDCVL